MLASHGQSLFKKSPAGPHLLSKALCECPAPPKMSNFSALIQHAAYRASLVFPADLTKQERAQLHKQAERIGLSSQSEVGSAIKQLHVHMHCIGPQCRRCMSMYVWCQLRFACCLRQQACCIQPCRLSTTQQAAPAVLLSDLGKQEGFSQAAQPR